MNLKKKLRDFFTLTRKGNDGFTLVELIVVIAILAILSGVGVPAYSGYVNRTNMTADQTLVSEMRQAAILAILNDYAHEFSGPVIVRLTTNGASIEASADDAAVLEEAMQAAFGENWADVCKLSYADWTGGAAEITAKYDASSYKGKEAALLDKVSSLTGAMGEFFASGKTVPTQIADILKEQGIDTTNSTAVANGAVAALADSISSAPAEVQAEITAALVNMPSTAVGGDLTATMTALNQAYSKIYTGADANSGQMVTLATTATLYAYAEAYSQFAAEKGYDTPGNTLASIEYKNADGSYKNATQIRDTVMNAFGSIITDSMTDTAGQQAVNDYFFNESALQAPKDADAFVSVMGALSESSDALKQNLTSGTFYTDGTAAGLLNGYLAAGRANIGAGEGAVIVNPDKTVTAYLGGMLG